MEKKVSIIIPCKDEQGTIQEIINRFPDHYELVFVDGRSKDDTIFILLRMKVENTNKSIQIVNQTGYGKADAVIAGLNAASGEVLAIFDGDMTILPEDIPEMIEKVEEGTLVIGERIEMGPGAFRFLNSLANEIFSRVWSRLCHCHIPDTLCGTKILMKNDWLKMAPIPDDPFLDFTLLHEARRLQIKIVSTPVKYYARWYGKTKIHRFWHGAVLTWITIRSFWELGK
jgi:glycosyltransferase involved in cell wall biosynthesis